MKKISLQTTKRAVAQNSRQAMRSQIKSALIELITNADDAYRDSGIEGPIRIELEDFDQAQFEYQVDEPINVVVSVSDQAGGMPWEQMEDKLTKYGNATSALAQGRLSRGFLGRGAKDVHIFGYSVFHNVNSSLFADLTLDSEGDGGLFDPRVPSPADLKRMGLGDDQEGFRASVLVTDQNAESVPAFSSLAKSLRQEAQLRFILQDRHVTLEDKRTGQKEVLEPMLLPGQEIFSGEIPVPDYKPVSLRLLLLDTEQTGDADAASSHGILVHTGPVAFENSWFNFRKELGTEWLRGELELPEALEIQRKESETPSAREGLIKLDRSGINADHPYFKAALGAASTVILQTLVSITAQKRTLEGETESTRRASAAASEALAQILKEFFEELEDEPTSTGDQPEMSDFDVIPGGIRVGLNQSKTISLRAIESLSVEPLHVFVESSTSSEDLIHGEFGAVDGLDWVNHSRLQRKVAQWRFITGSNAGVLKVTFKLGGHSAACKIVVSDIPPEEVEIPEHLEFERARNQVSPGRGKNLVLKAPITEVGTEVKISYSGDEVTGPESVLLTSSPNGDFATERIHLVAGRAVGEVSILATSTNTGEEAEAVVEVKLDSSLKGFRPDLKINAMKNPSSRAVFRKVNGVYTSFIYPEHSSFNGEFGDYDEVKDAYSRDSMRDVRATMAITHAEQVARFMTERESEVHDMDAAAVLQAFFKNHTRVAKVLGKIYASDSEVDW